MRQRFPVEAGHRIVLIVGVVDAALDEHAPRADRLRIFGHQRPLLREAVRAQAFTGKGPKGKRQSTTAPTDAPPRHAAHEAARADRPDARTARGAANAADRHGGAGPGRALKSVGQKHQPLRLQLQTNRAKAHTGTGPTPPRATPNRHTPNTTQLTSPLQLPTPAATPARPGPTRASMTPRPQLPSPPLTTTARAWNSPWRRSPRCAARRPHGGGFATGGAASSQRETTSTPRRVLHRSIQVAGNRRVFEDAKIANLAATGHSSGPSSCSTPTKTEGRGQSGHGRRADDDGRRHALNYRSHRRSRG